MDFKPYIELPSSLLTPTIGAITTYIAIQQYKSNKAKLRFALYEKRLAFYRAVMSFIVRGKSLSITDGEMTEINPTMMEADFSFGEDLSSHIQKIYLQGIKKRSVERAQQGASGEEQEKLALEIEETQDWFSDQVNPTHKNFKRYLNLKAAKVALTRALILPPMQFRLKTEVRFGRCAKCS